jgi:hypothetical protein
MRLSPRLLFVLHAHPHLHAHKAKPKPLVTSFLSTPYHHLRTRLRSSDFCVFWDGVSRVERVHVVHTPTAIQPYVRTQFACRGHTWPASRYPVVFSCSCPPRLFRSSDFCVLWDGVSRIERVHVVHTPTAIQPYVRTQFACRATDGQYRVALLCSVPLLFPSTFCCCRLRVGVRTDFAHTVAAACTSESAMQFPRTSTPASITRQSSLLYWEGVAVVPQYSHTH